MSVSIQQVKKAEKQIEHVKDQLKVESGDLLTQAEKEAVDELLKVTQELAAVQPKIKKQGDLKKFLLSVAMDETRFPLDTVALLKGDKGLAQFSPQSHPREIQDMNGLIAELKKKAGGYEGLLKFIKINLSDIDEYLTEAERKPFIGTKNGSRTLKTVLPKG